MKLNSIRLYQPDAALRERIGDDITPLTVYVKALQKVNDDFWAKRGPAAARGLIIAIGVKPGKVSRAWCEAVEGEIPVETLRELENQLGAAGPPEVKVGPIALALEVLAGEQKVEKFPVIPKSWIPPKGDGKGVVIPDGLFKMIWPDE